MRLALNNHIRFWDVRRQGDTLLFCTSIQGFKNLKPAIKKARCRIRITQKKGLPFLFFRYRKRTLFAGGSLLFCIGLYILCSFVWLIEVVGNERIDTTAIVTCLEDAGYEVGMFKGKLDLREAEKVLMNAYPEIVWVGIAFEGTKLQVQVSESVPKPTIYQAGAPSDMLAKRDALITYAVADKGMPCVKVGDAVKKGEVLITGKIPLEVVEGGHYLTESIGKVEGKTAYYLEATCPLTETKKHYQNDVATSYHIKLFNLEIPLWQSKKTFQHFDELFTINQLQLTEKLPLPFYFEKHEKVAYIPETVTIEDEKAQEHLVRDLFDQLYASIGKEAKVLKHQVSYEKAEEAWYATLIVIAEEPIGYYEAIPVEEQVVLPTQTQEGVN